jgi:hypothetical protein
MACRKVRKQRVEAFAKAYQEGALVKNDEDGKPIQPSQPTGEYLGDVEIDAAFWKKLTNFNPFVNNVGAVPQGKYLLIADFDYAGDGRFLGLRLEKLIGEGGEANG